MNLMRSWQQALFALAIAVPAIAEAAPGDVDTAFGEVGLFRLPTSQFAGFAAFVAKSANGDLLFTGASDLDAVSGRLLPEGTLDTTFGGLGYVRHPRPQPGQGSSAGSEGILLTPHPDGGAFLVEIYRTPCILPRLCTLGGEPPIYANVRSISVDGVLDAAFGTQGAETIPNFNTAQALAGYPPSGFSLLSHPRGIINARTWPRLARLDASGRALGPPLALACPGLPEAAGTAAIGSAPGSRLVVAQITFSPRKLCLARLDAQGSPDPAFGQQGFVVRDDLLIGAARTDVVAVFSKSTGGIAVVMQQYATDSRYVYVVFHFNANGTLDEGRFDRGIAGPTDLHVARLTAVAMQDDDKLLVAGYPGVPTSVNPLGVDEARPRIGRLLDAGGADLTFGSAGSGFVSLVIAGRAFAPKYINWTPDAIHLAGASKTAGSAEPTQLSVVRLVGAGVPPVVAVPSGGGGCYTNSTNRPDPTLALLAMLASMALLLRRGRETKEKKRAA